MGLSDDQKSLLKSTLPSIVGVLSGAVAVFSFMQSIIFTHGDAKQVLSKMQDIEERTARLEELVNDNKNHFSLKIDKIEERIEANGEVNNKEILGRIRDLDNNINRRIDNIYEKLIERKR